MTLRSTLSSQITCLFLFWETSCAKECKKLRLHISTWSYHWARNQRGFLIQFSIIPDSLKIFQNIHILLLNSFNLMKLKKVKLRCKTGHTRMRNNKTPWEIFRSWRIFKKITDISKTLGRINFLSCFITMNKWLFPMHNFQTFSHFDGEFSVSTWLC